MISSSDVYQSIRTYAPDNKLVVAYSGGLDSHVLLHLLSQHPNARHQLRAIHVNHGLQASSIRWVEHCEKICMALGVPLEVITLNLTIAKGESVEEVARTARYKMLHQSLEENESLLTAHHLNDQVETFMLNLFRGAGVDGLASMPVSRLFGPKELQYQLLRPLLSYSRKKLEMYAEKYQLAVVEDPSNLDDSFDRNYLRQKILPQLNQRWVGLDKTIARAASIQSEAKEILNEVAEQAFKQVYDNKKKALSISRLKTLSKAKQKLVIRYWIAANGFSYFSEKKLQHVFSDVIEADQDTQPLLEWQGAQLRRFQNHLYLSEPLLPHDATRVIKWDLRSPLTINPLNLTISPEELPKGALNVTVRFRQGGEKIRIPNRGHLSLKNIFQEEGVPPWLRNRLPLLYIGDELFQVVGLDLK